MSIAHKSNNNKESIEQKKKHNFFNVGASQESTCRKARSFKIFVTDFQMFAYLVLSIFKVFLLRDNLSDTKIIPVK